MSNPNVDMMTAFSQVFAPKNQFPRWYQPNPNIGAMLVQNQEEEDELAARDWTPKPLPGSELPKPAMDTQQQLDQARAELEERMAVFARQQSEFFAAVDARIAGSYGGQVPPAEGTAPASAPAAPLTGDAAATSVLGDLSDSSVDVASSGSDAADEKAPAVIVPGAGKGKK